MSNIISYGETSHKVCTRCRLSLPFSEFHKKKHCRHGLNPVCKRCRYIINKAYYSSPAGKAAVSCQTKRKWIRVRQKVSARNLINSMLEDGLISKGPCEVCGTRILIEGHHDDHARPTEVRWLCKRHHLELHNKVIVKQEIEYASN